MCSKIRGEDRTKIHQVWYGMVRVHVVHRFFLYCLIFVWWIFVFRSHCSLHYIVYICAQILLFIIWYGACLAKILLFIIWYGACLGKNSVVHYPIWCCFNTDSAVHYLDRGSVVHYLICCMFGQRFCSLSDTVNVWTEVLFFIVSSRACLDTDFGVHYLAHPAA